jgi:hypothetical protein
MSTKSRQTIYGGSIMGAKIRAQRPVKPAGCRTRGRSRPKRRRSIRVDGYGAPRSPPRPSANAPPPLDAIRRPRATPIWKLKAALKGRSGRKGPKRCSTPNFGYDPDLQVCGLFRRLSLEWTLKQVSARPSAAVPFQLRPDFRKGGQRVTEVGQLRHQPTTGGCLSFVGPRSWWQHPTQLGCLIQHRPSIILPISSGAAKITAARSPIIPAGMIAGTPPCGPWSPESVMKRRLRSQNARVLPSAVVTR